MSRTKKTFPGTRIFQKLYCKRNIIRDLEQTVREIKSHNQHFAVLSLTIPYNSAILNKDIRHLFYNRKSEESEVIKMTYTMTENKNSMSRITSAVLK